MGDSVKLEISLSKETSDKISQLLKKFPGINEKVFVELAVLGAVNRDHSYVEEAYHDLGLWDYVDGEECTSFKEPYAETLDALQDYLKNHG